MRISLGGLTILAAAALAAPALAQDAATAPPSPITITGGATLISDYRFRGISQTNTHFAVQGTFSVAHSSGLYASVWGSSIDDYVAAGSNQEIDLSAGYKKTVSGTTIDGGVLYYYYPGNRKGTDTDFFEPYISATHTFGPIGAKIGGNFAWKQRALNNGEPGHYRDGGAYAYGELSAAVPNTGLTITGHVGHSFIKDYISFDTRYTDWNIQAAYSYKALTFSIAYVDTDRKLFSYPAGGGRNRNVAGSGVVGAISAAF